MIGERRATLLLLILCILIFFPNVEIAKAEEETIYIREDGTVEGTDKIQHDGNFYTFTDNISGSIILEKGNIEIDGAGYALQGNGSGTGIYFESGVNVTIRNMEISHFRWGIDGISANSTLSGNTIINNEANGVNLKGDNHNMFGNIIANNSNYGVLLYFSDYNTVSKNKITENRIGVYLYGSFYNSIYDNSVINNSDAGLWFFGSHNNYLLGNNITDNQISMHFEMQCLGNRIYYNNFVNNELQFFADIDSINFWDNGTIGNYWSDYTGIDWNGDGIGDNPYIIDENNRDNYPMMEPAGVLMAPVTIFNAGTWEGEKYNVNVVSNSTVSEFSFDPEATRIRFNVTGETGTAGFCNVTIPKGLLYTEGGWAVIVDGTSVTPTIDEDATSTYLHFTYLHSTKTVYIIGTKAIPEFPSWTPLLITLVAVVAVAVVYRHELNKHNQRRF